MDFTKPPFRCLAIFVGIAIIFALATFGVYQIVKSQNEASQGRTTTLSAEGKVNVIPDVAKVNFSIILENESIEELTNESNLTMQTVVDYLKSVNVAEKDIKTTTYSLRPVYEEKCFNDYSGYRRCNSELSKYKLNQVVEVTIRDFTTIDSIISKATELGVNNVSNLDFSVEDVEKVKNEAKIQAINKIMERAEDISKATGVKLGKIVNISESFYGGYVERQPANEMKLYSDTAAMGVASAPIEVGSEDVTANVSITFRIK